MNIEVEPGAHSIVFYQQAITDFDRIANNIFTLCFTKCFTRCLPDSINASIRTAVYGNVTSGAEGSLPESILRYRTSHLKTW
jgi:hypothetical protein